MSNSLQSHGLQPARLHCPWDFPGKDTGVGYNFLLQGIFQTQGFNPSLLIRQVDSLPPGRPWVYICKCARVCVCVCVRHSVVFNSLQPHGLHLERLLCLWNSPGKNTEVHCHSLLKRIFPTQVLNSCLPHCGQILYHLSYWKHRYICRCC